MSYYLVERIQEADNLEVRLRTTVVSASGDGHLEQLQLCDEAHNTVEEVATSWWFVFIEAAPRTEWLGDVVARDDRGFLLTGQAAGRRAGLAAGAGAVRPGDQRAERLRCR
jgi:thioredoxin reductase (NADPH)